jgi:uncharacterized protein YidB (DUF937 family)
MGLLEDLIKASGSVGTGGGTPGGGGGGGGIVDFIAKNPMIVTAAISMLSSQKGSIGPSNGLGGLIDAFTTNGLGDHMSSWISTGPNRAVTPKQISDVLGSDVLAQFSRQAGISQGDAGSVLASVLPGLISGLTPQGKVPAQSSLEGTLGSLLSSLAR